MDVYFVLLWSNSFIILSGFFVYSYDWFTHILQDCFTGTEAIIWFSVKCHYNAVPFNTILLTAVWALRWQGQVVNQTLISHQTPHTSPTRGSYGVSIVRIWDKAVGHIFPTVNKSALVPSTYREKSHSRYWSGDLLHIVSWHCLVLYFRCKQILNLLKNFDKVLIKSLQLIWRTGTHSWNLQTSEVGVTKPISSVPPFLLFSTLSIYTLAIEYHVYIWQVSPQLSCGDTWQIWMWFKESNRYFKLTNRVLVTPTPGLQKSCSDLN